MEEFCLTEEDVKLRGLVCQLLKEVFLEVYSNASVVPFGSTVSGAGWKGSDLDLCLLTDDPSDAVDLDFSVVIDILRSFAPGCVNIIPVMSAKCPLIKFKHQPSDLACDLSINNRWEETYGLFGSNRETILQYYGCYYSWAGRESLFSLQLHADEAIMAQYNRKWPISLAYESKPWKL